MLPDQALSSQNHLHDRPFILFSAPLFFSLFLFNCLALFSNRAVLDPTVIIISRIVVSPIDHLRCFLFRKLFGSRMCRQCFEGHSHRIVYKHHNLSGIRYVTIALMSDKFPINKKYLS